MKIPETLDKTVKVLSGLASSYAFFMAATSPLGLATTGVYLLAGTALTGLELAGVNQGRLKALLSFPKSSGILEPFLKRVAFNAITGGAARYIKATSLLAQYSPYLGKIPVIGGVLQSGFSALSRFALGAFARLVRFAPSLGGPMLTAMPTAKNLFNIEALRVVMPRAFGAAGGAAGAARSAVRRVFSSFSSKGPGSDGPKSDGSESDGGPNAKTRY